MTDRRKADAAIIKKLGQLKPGMCPNFYLTGESIPALEGFARRLAATIEEKNLIRFQGAVKDFTILMPYFTEGEEARAFLRHLNHSVSIARDCYDRFCGIVLIELLIEWGERGFNRAMDAVLDYIRQNEQICFFILLPLAGKQKSGENFFRELSRCSTWMKLSCKTPSPRQCIALFQALAVEQGNEISSDAKGVLLNQLRQRSQTSADNAQVVAQLLEQILFDRKINADDRTVIGVEDVMGIAGTTAEKRGHTIGFAADLWEEDENV